MVFRIFRVIKPFFLALLVGVAAMTTASRSQNAQETLRQENLVVQSGDQTHRFVVEVAETDRQRSRGLMYREEMAADHGMLFVFDGEGERFFWMKNTPLPLDIIYIGATGDIVSIAADTTPFSEKVIPSGEAAKFVLELNAGTSASLGIDVGDKVSSPSMAGE